MVLLQYITECKDKCYNLTISMKIGDNHNQLKTEIGLNNNIVITVILITNYVQVTYVRHVVIAAVML